MVFARRRLLVALAVGAVALAGADAAWSKPTVSTTCGGERCRTVTDGVSGIAVLPGRVAPPTDGRFYTIAFQLSVNGDSTEGTVIYEAKRQIVRAADKHARATLGDRWTRLAPDVRPAYASAVKGLAPMQAMPTASSEAPATHRTISFDLTDSSRTTAGILLLTVLAVEFGGLTLLQITRGRQPATEFQKAFARAGHAHAGVFVIFAIVAQILADAAQLDGAADMIARSGIWIAAVLFPAGFFAASAGRGTTKPNRLIALVYAGIVILTAGVLALGIGLLTA